jgi:2-oxoisovalerate dehydrogenase E1 component alpha subunit
LISSLELFPDIGYILTIKPLNPKETSVVAEKPALKSVSANKPEQGRKKDASFRLDEATLKKIHSVMIKTRVLEERLIKMYKQNDGYFWIGGPGEEAFNIPLGMNVHKGEGPNYDYLHLHYRSSGILLGMGAEPTDFIRQMKNVASDPFSGGRNFGNHASIRKWNVLPITSTIETQYATAIGTGIAQRQNGGKGLTIVNGGDAGSAEGEFASCLVWSTMPKKELPIFMIVTNNEFGISTPKSMMSGDRAIADRGKAFGMKTRVINGNDVEESYFAIQEAMEYIRTERKPYLLEARVSRLYGHSSASGANFVGSEADPIERFEEQLESQGVLTKKAMTEIREKYTAEFLEIAKRVKEEAMPDPSTIYDNTYWKQKGKYW